MSSGDQETPSKDPRVDEWWNQYLDLYEQRKTIDVEDFLSTCSPDVASVLRLRIEAHQHAAQLAGKPSFYIKLPCDIDDYTLFEPIDAGTFGVLYNVRGRPKQATNGRVEIGH